MTFSRLADIAMNPQLFPAPGYQSPNIKSFPVQCGIVFGVAGWTTTMTVIDENQNVHNRILTKHFF